MTAKLKSTFVSTLHSKYQDEISRAIWLSSLKTPEHFQFFYKMVQETLLSLKNHSYTDFDAQTTSNCCHGLSVLVRRLILALHPELEDLAAFVNLLNTHELMEHLPNALIDLTSIYILTIIVEIDPHKGRRTSPQKLKSKTPIGTSFCRSIVKELQKTFSIYVAENYINLGLYYGDSPWISDTKLGAWVKYLEKSFIRLDKRGVKYASALFSMQICLHYLSVTNATIALVCDFLDSSSKDLKDRYVCLFRSNENNQFIPTDFSQDIDPTEPIFVLGGYAYNESLTIEQLALKLEPWIYQLPVLILSCDLHYPEFPNVRDDPDFDSSRIQPSENSILEIFEQLKKIPGFSANNPSMFCLSHIFLSSSKLLANVRKNVSSDNFPNCYLPSPIQTIA